MEIPSRSHAAWKALVMNETTYVFEFLGLQLLLKRLTLKVSLKPTTDNVNQGIDEVRTMFVENITLPKVQRDLEKIFGTRGDVL